MLFFALSNKVRAYLLLPALLSTSTLHLHVQHAIVPISIQMQQNSVAHADSQTPHGWPPPSRQTGVALTGRHKALVRQFVDGATAVDEVDAALEERLVGLVAHGGWRNVQVHIGQQLGGL